MITTRAVVEIVVSTNDAEVIEIFDEDAKALKKAGLVVLETMLLEDFDKANVIEFEMFKNEIGEDAQLKWMPLETLMTCRECSCQSQGRETE